MGFRAAQTQNSIWESSSRAQHIGCKKWLSRFERAQSAVRTALVLARIDGACAALFTRAGGALGAVIQPDKSVNPPRD